jgi:hypothetical protein
MPVLPPNVLPRLGGFGVIRLGHRFPLADGHAPTGLEVCEPKLELPPGRQLGSIYYI